SSAWGWRASPSPTRTLIKSYPQSHTLTLRNHEPAARAFLREHGPSLRPLDVEGRDEAEATYIDRCKEEFKAANKRCGIRDAAPVRYAKPSARRVAGCWGRLKEDRVHYAVLGHR